MSEQVPALIVYVPLFVALMLPALCWLSTRLVRALAVLAVAASHALSVAALVHALTVGTESYHVGGWLPPWGIEYVIDPLAAGMAALVSFISLLVVVYSGPYLKVDPPLRKGAFYALYLLLTSGLLGIVCTGDVFNLYVFLEISALSTYALVSSGGDRAVVAAFRYLLIGTVGASFYLLSVGYLYSITGTLNMADLAAQLPSLLDSRAVVVAVALLVAGLGIKMALFPLHGWLPDAYSFAPPPVTAFISAVMAKVGAYVLYRMLFFVFGAAGPVDPALNVVGWAAAAGILAGSIMAIAQRDFFRMLAYSSVAQMGYIALGFSLGNAMGLIGALLHVLNHSVMKGCLFMVAGGVRWKTEERDIYRFAEMSRRMPLVMGAFLVAAMSMIGLPPTGGFFSKWYLVLGSLDAGAWPFACVIVLSSLLNAIYFFRVIEHVYLRRRAEKTGPEPAESEAPAPAPATRPRLELPLAMMAPILLLGAGILALGVFSESIVSHVITSALPWGVP